MPKSTASKLLPSNRCRPLPRRLTAADSASGWCRQRVLCADGSAITADAVEFGRAMEEFKRATGQRFPTWSAVLQVLRHLGYEKRSTAALAAA